MALKVVIDFVGMSVVVERNTGSATTAKFVGLLDERHHVHLVSFRSGGLPVFKGLKPGTYTFKNVVPGDATINDPDKLLPDLHALSGGDIRSVAAVDKAMRARIQLPGGTLMPQTPVLGIAKGPWDFAAKGTGYLTDRMRFEAVALKDNVDVTLSNGNSEDDIVVPVEGNEFRLVVSAIDSDVGERNARLKKGFPLTEFGLFYSCTEEFGPIPTYKGGTGFKFFSNPDEPICPIGHLPPS